MPKAKLTPSLDLIINNVDHSNNNIINNVSDITFSNITSNITYENIDIPTIAINNNIIEDSLGYIIKDIFELLKVKPGQESAASNTLIISSSITQAESLARHLKFLEEEVALLLPPDCPIYDFLSPGGENVFQRLESLHKIAKNSQNNDGKNNKGNFSIITTKESALGKYLPKNIIEKLEFKLVKNQEINYQDLIKGLINYGYIETELTRFCGDFSVRGAVIDIAVPQLAIRLDFFGNIIESIKLFNVITQKTYQEIEEISFFPLTEVIFSFIEKKNLIFPASHYLANIEPLNRRLGQENWLPVFYNNELDNLFEFTTINKIVFINGQKLEEGKEVLLESLKETYEKIAAGFALKQKPELQYPTPSELFLEPKELQKTLQGRPEQAKTLAGKAKIKEKIQELSQRPIYKPLELLAHDLKGNLEKIKAFLNDETFSMASTPIEKGFNNGKPAARSLLICCSSLGRLELIPQILQNALGKETYQDYQDYKIIKNFSEINFADNKSNRNNKANEANNSNKNSKANKAANKTSINLTLQEIETGFLREAIREPSFIEKKLYNEKGQKEILLVISDKYLFHKSVNKSGQSRRARKAIDSIDINDELEIGDPVIHRDYGIGLFNGFQKIATKVSTETLVEINDFSASLAKAVTKTKSIVKTRAITKTTIKTIKHDCIEILYSAGDKILLPVENIRLITRYPKQEGLKLDRLGSLNWQLRCSKVKNHIRLIADELMRLAALRKTTNLKETYKLDENYYKFCENFPYIETEDQLRAINDIEEDFKTGKIIERLICGDTGFGKTEVAMRAAFLIVNQSPNNQVAVIAPTTLLAKQHFRNFEERFKLFNIKTVNLSRLASRAEIEEAKRALKAGSLQLAIGTHAVLNSEFKNLQLAIIDEEQLFGVKQKEKLKQLYPKIHVLALSATPIPRSLQMSLSGLRDLSVIITPPMNRIPPVINIIELELKIIKEAILREYRRGGKTYFVCPKIKQLDQNIDMLEAILPPEINLAKAHGEMLPEELNNIMADFYEGKFHVLVATTIIQNGIDIESANTIIVQNAHMFGLGQLYQLRGRVGRGKLLSYAYFIIPPEISAIAKQRLNTLRSVNNLGCGLNIAMHDMDIRGFGNLIGEKQSGKIKEVGVELYNKFLSEALQEAPAVEAAADVKINIPLEIGIPENYIDDFKLRMSLYRQISEISLEEIDSFTAEIIDRFGSSLPEAFQNLLKIAALQKLAVKLFLTKIDITKGSIALTFSETFLKNNESNELSLAPRASSLKLENILSYVMQAPHKFKLKGKDQIIIIKQAPDYRENLINAFEEINNLLAVGLHV